MPGKTKSFRKWRSKQLDDPKRAANYVAAAINDSPEMFLVALRNVAESYRMAAVAEEAGLSRETLYRTLSEDGNPRLSSLVAILDAVGLKLSVKPNSEVAGVIPEALQVLSGYLDEAPRLGIGKTAQTILATGGAFPADTFGINPGKWRVTVDNVETVSPSVEQLRGVGASPGVSFSGIDATWVHGGKEQLEGHYV